MKDHREHYAQLIKREAKALGFLSCGISKAGFLEKEAPKLEQWLNQNRHGKMYYMENHFDKRLDPTLLVPGAKSVVSLLLNYHTEEKQKDPLAPKVSSYAFGQDYHSVIKEKLKILIPFDITLNIFGFSKFILFGLVLFTLNYFIYQYSSFTLMIFTAVIVSILYIEMGIILSRNFFVKFFDDQLPKEIIYFIGFILMINAGYFTIMFILKIIKANSLI